MPASLLTHTYFFSTWARSVPALYGDNLPSLRVSQPSPSHGDSAFSGGSSRSASRPRQDRATGLEPGHTEQNPPKGAGDKVMGDDEGSNGGRIPARVDSPRHNAGAHLTLSSWSANSSSLKPN